MQCSLSLVCVMWRSIAVAMPPPAAGTSELPASPSSTGSRFTLGNCKHTQQHPFLTSHVSKARFCGTSDESNIQISKVCLRTASKEEEENIDKFVCNPLFAKMRGFAAKGPISIGRFLNPFLLGDVLVPLYSD